jgi:predicted Zn-dependent peptidase
MSSRLFQKIREDRGLCYSVYTYASSYRYDGMFTVYAGTTKEDYSEVIEIIKKPKLILGFFVVFAFVMLISCLS